MRFPKFRTQLLVILAGLVVAALAVLYHVRSNHCMLYYYGAPPEEVPQGTAIALLNPLRNRADEKNAEWLIRDLRTTKCDEVSKELLADPARICSTMHGNTEARLVWLDPPSDTMHGGTRRLIYDLPARHARLVVYFGADEPGWGVKTVSVVH